MSHRRCPCDRDGSTYVVPDVGSHHLLVTVSNTKFVMPTSGTVFLVLTSASASDTRIDPEGSGGSHGKPINNCSNPFVFSNNSDGGATRGGGGVLT